MLKKSILILGAVLLALAFYQIFNAAERSGGASAVSVSVRGAVKNGIDLSYSDIAKMKGSTRRVKFYNEKNEYAVSCEMEGVALCDVISAAGGVAKKADDGFDRELDMFVVVRGASGRSAVFSYGEIFLSGARDSVFISRSARQIFPHKHEDLKPFGFYMNEWRQAPRSYDIDFKNCASCHNGKDERPVYFPKGICAVAVFDRSPARLIEDVSSIEVCQIAARKIVPEKDRDNMWCDAAAFVREGGSSSEVSAGSLIGCARAVITEDTVGLGKGFHGRIAFEGYDMAAVLKNIPGGPAAADIGRSYAVFTAADGYRSLFSGGEIFDHANGTNLLLVDRQDGKDLQKGDGRFRAFIRGDYFIDRSVRSVKEIYYNTLSE